MCTPAFAATAAAASVPEPEPDPSPLPPDPLAEPPSENNTIVADGQKPMLGALPLGPRATVLCVIADSEARMAAPSEVPPPALSRPTADRAVARFALGIVASRPVSANAMTPMFTLAGCASINARAAFFAALSRLGGTSVAAMLPETSMARMTVPLACESGTGTAGPETAIASAAVPASGHPTPLSRQRLPPATVTPAEASVAARRLTATNAAHARAAATTRPPAGRVGSADGTG